MSDVPKVVLLGKSTSKNPAIQDMLQNMKHTLQIPPHFLDSVYVTLASSETYKIQKKHLLKGVDYKNIEKHLHDIGIREEIAIIEIVIDLDKAMTQVQKDTLEFLNDLFDE
jgi:hypothetical protein